MSVGFDRRITVTVRDGNGELLRGANIEWYVADKFVGGAYESDGHANLELTDLTAVVTVRVLFKGEIPQEARLASGQTSYEFRYQNVYQHSTWKDFAMKHFPAVIGIVFIVAAVVLVFVFKQPTVPQLHIVYAMLALGGGGFGGEIAGFIKVDMNLGTKLAISAGGAAAIFVLLYFFEPAGSETRPTPNAVHSPATSP